MRVGCYLDEAVSNAEVRWRCVGYESKRLGIHHRGWYSFKGAAYRAPGRAARAIAQGAPSIPEEGLPNDVYALAFTLFAGAVTAGFLAYSRRKRGAAAATVAAATQPPPGAGATQAIDP